MPLVSFATITPKEQWLTVLAAIFKGSMGRHVELDIVQARNLIRNIIGVKALLPSDAVTAIQEMDKEFADLQAQGIQVVIFNLQPIGTKP